MKKALLALALAAVCLSAAEIPGQTARQAPEFAIHMGDGTNLHLERFHGKVVCLAFVFTTCPHCQNMMQVLAPIQKEYAAKGVQVLASAFNTNSKDLLPGFSVTYVQGFPVGWNDQMEVLGFLNLPATQPYFVPILVFIDRKGMIREQYIGDENYLRTPDQSVRASLARMLALPSGPSGTTITKRKTAASKAQ